MILLAAVAFGGGAVLATAGSSSTASQERALATRFLRAWAHRDYAQMYATIDPAARRRITAAQFASTYEQAAATATATQLHLRGRPRLVSRGGGGANREAIEAQVVMRTRVFGTIEGRIELRFAGRGTSVRIAWSPALRFPGLTAGQRLARRMTLPPRAELLAREGSVLASGPASAAGERFSPLGAAASSVVGSIGPIPKGERAQLAAEGVPANAIVGVSGLEAIFDARLRGRPGGELLAGSHVIAKVAPKASPPVRTTIAPALQEATVKAMGEHYGGVVALQPSTGQILAVAGVGLDGLQPPGSTFKMVSVTGILQSGIATPQSTFPYETHTVLGGVTLNNAESESCGGTLVLSFAVSCNSVFAPLGVKLGASRLVATAERYGFDRPPGIPGAAQSTIPQAREFHGEFEVGSSTIGQGRVLATPLQMAVVAATIADGGVRHIPTYSPTAPGRPIVVSSRKVASEVRTMMIHVVREGTGPNAAIPGVTVAGKTGTAELGGPGGCAGEGSATGGASGEAGGPGESGRPAGSGEGCSRAAVEKASTDAWFAAFAPAEAPKLAVGVLMVRDGYGAESAAPVAKQVLEAGLGLELG